MKRWCVWLVIYHRSTMTIWRTTSYELGRHWTRQAAREHQARVARALPADACARATWGRR